MTQPDASRPSPDDLLDAANAADGVAGRPRQGRLKIFVGMCAGVGKTYTMLQDAHARKDEGVDVVIGLAESHGRPETQALIAHLPALPLKPIDYRGIQLMEFDLDAALARRPALLILDELPHTNAPGSRHPKRFQDLFELLNAGIDVYSAINVQHLESRADVAAQITGVPVRETVPDSVLERADEIELIDLSPDDLLKRLGEGKVYLGAGQASAATRAFFRRGNLTALREMALRVTADRVDKQMRDYMHSKRIDGPWKSAERVMVAVNAGAQGERLIRHARRIVHNGDIAWLAVHVDTGAILSTRAREAFERNIALARELGAEVITTTDADVVNGLLRIARQNNITRLIVGKPSVVGIGGWLAALLHRGTASRLIQESGAIDIQLVGGGDLARDQQPKSAQSNAAAPASYALALGAMAGVIGICFGVSQSILLNQQVVALTLLLALMLLAQRLALGPILAVTLLSALALNFLFIAPVFTFAIASVSDGAQFVLFFAISTLVGVLTTRIRSTERLLRQRESQAVAAYNFAHALSQSENMADTCRIAAQQLRTLFHGPVQILLPDAGHVLRDHAVVPAALPGETNEMAVATWAMEHARQAGRFSDTLPDAKSSYFPLMTANGVVGVLGLGMEQALSTQQRELLDGLVNQTALAVERETLEVAAKLRTVYEESQRLYKTLINLISHELRTPLTVISGAASSLMEAAVDQDARARAALHKSMHTSAEQLNQLIGNLLDMTRLESGSLRLNLDWTEVSDLLNTARDRASTALAFHDFGLDIAPGLPLVKMDVLMMEQVVYNLLHNAARHTPKGTRVVLAARREGAWLALTVRDDGPGFPADQVAHAFDKFQRGKDAVAGGLGLGLSICKGLVEAHEGSIDLVNSPDGGAQVNIRLPIHQMPEITENSDE